MLKDPEKLSDVEQDRLIVRVSQVFSPNTPIDKKQLFAGRKPQIHQLIDAIFQRGQHVIVYGERGVGKTSLVKVLPDFIEAAELNDIVACRVPCTSEDSSDSLWKKMFSEIDISEDEENPRTLDEDIAGKKVTPHLIHQQLKRITSGDRLVVLTFDEIDILKDKKVKQTFAETIKSISDDATRATIVLAGVADDVDALIEYHPSTERNLIQIHMPRMSEAESKEILITNGLDALNLGIEDSCTEKIIKISQGLPHYVHLLGRNSAREAIEEGSRNIRQKHIGAAIEKSISQVHQTTKSEYIKAVSSSRKNTNYKEVLLACALAESDEFSKFAAVDVREPMRKVMKRETYRIENFAKNLTDLSGEKRGSILEKSGQPRSYRYKFRNPLMQAYVIMRGIKEGLIS